MTNEERKVIELALEALLKTQNEGFNLPGSSIREAITAIKEALAQPEQEPVAVVDVHEFYDNCANFSLLQKLPKGKHTLYTAPPQRTWVGLTDEDEIDWEEGGNLKDLVKAIEAKLKEKNNG